MDNRDGGVGETEGMSNVCPSIPIVLSDGMKRVHMYVGRTVRVRPTAYPSIPMVRWDGIDSEDGGVRGTEGNVPHQSIHSAAWDGL